MTFSIIVVCLNAGEKLRETIDSILNQTWQDYEIIIKDGGSTEAVTRKLLDGYRGGVRKTERDGTESEVRLKSYSSKDTGIYDAMNQAVQYVCGDYVLFLNCGDSFYDAHVLEQTAEKIREWNRDTGCRVTDGGNTLRAETPRCIFYGNIYERQTGTQVQSNPVMNDFACYRNVPCHQACFYEAQLLREKPFDTAYAVRADYEHFLWCYYKARAKTVYMPVTVARYEGGGFSETKENERRSRREHREIVNKYIPAGKVRKYRLIMALTLSPVRTWIAKNPVTAGGYQKVKKALYSG